MKKFLAIISCIFLVNGCTSHHAKVTIEEVAPAKPDIAITEVVEEKIK